MHQPTEDAPVVVGLAIHPLKGARAVPLEVMPLDALGAVADRRWMVVDDGDVVLTPRDVPMLALIEAAVDIDGSGEIDERTITLRLPGQPSLRVTQRVDAPERTVRCWDDPMRVAEADPDASAWMSRALDRRCTLVHMVDSTHRPLAAKYAGGVPHESRGVAATDGAPLLVLGTGSIDALNARLAAAGQPPADARRFRANILVGNVAAHAEDAWSRIRIGGVEIGIGSPCPRCVVTTIDPDTFERGAEPLRTLATYRRADGNKVMFGMNATHVAPGVLTLGDIVTVMSR